MMSSSSTGVRVSSSACLFGFDSDALGLRLHSGSQLAKVKIVIFRGIITCTLILAVRRRASAIQSALPASFIASTDGASRLTQGHPARVAASRKVTLNVHCYCVPRTRSTPSLAPAVPRSLAPDCHPRQNRLPPSQARGQVRDGPRGRLQRDAGIRPARPTQKADIAYAAPLANFGIKQACDGRKVGGHLNCLDISSEYCQRLKGLVVDRLDGHDKDEGNAWCEVLVEDRHAGPAETAMARLDMDSWLKSLPVRHRRIAQFLANGETTRAAARKFKVSDGRISQLRRELAANWHRFVGDEPEANAA